MKTEILSSASIELAISSLLQGEVVAIPTETVYGLAALYDNEKAIEKIYKIKKRPKDNPLIVHISSIEMIDLLAVDLPLSFSKITERFFPGPLTVLLNKHPALSEIVCAGHATVAVRMPSHPLARELIHKVGKPLVAPSANLSGRPSPTNVFDVLEDLFGKIPYIVDGGPCALGIESTVLDLSQKKARIVRPGLIAKEEIEAFLKEEIEYGKGASPGTKYRHYAPNVPIFLYEDPQVLKRELEKDLSLKRMILGKGFTPFSPSNLFSLLRQADRRDEAIFIYLDPTTKENIALMNRILKAAGKE